MELAGTVLNKLPSRSRSRRSTLSTSQVVKTRLQQSERVLHVRALGESSSEEDGVDSEDSPRPTLEEDGGQEQSAPEGNLQDRHDRHGKVVIFLDEVSNSLGNGVGRRLGTGRSASRNLTGLDSGNHVVSRVGGDMEDRVNAVRKHS